MAGGIGVDRIVVVVHPDRHLLLTLADHVRRVRRHGMRRQWIERRRGDGAGYGRARGHRFGLRPAHAAWQAVAALHLDIAGDHVEHVDRRLLVRTPDMLAGATIGEGGGRFRAGKLAGDARDVRGGNPGLLLRKLRRVRLQVILELGHGDIGPVRDELLIGQPFIENHMRHGERHCGIGARIRREPLIGPSRGVGHAHVKGDDFGFVTHHAIHAALRVGIHEIGRLQNVRSEIEDVLGVGPITGFDIRSPGGLQTDLL